MTRPTEQAVERAARRLCRSGKFETGQGTCAVLCMDQLGDVRKKGCGHCVRVHGKMAADILSADLGNMVLVPREATPEMYAAWMCDHRDWTHRYRAMIEAARTNTESEK